MSMKNSAEEAVKNYEGRKKEFFDELKELVRIPSVSFDGYEGYDKSRVLACGEKTAELMRKHGLKNVQIIPFENAHPYIFGELIHDPKLPTLLLYAHYDVQPPGKRATPISRRSHPRGGSTRAIR